MTSSPDNQPDRHDASTSLAVGEEDRSAAGSATSMGGRPDLPAAHAATTTGGRPDLQVGREPVSSSNRVNEAESLQAAERRLLDLLAQGRPLGEVLTALGAVAASCRDARPADGSNVTLAELVIRTAAAAGERESGRTSSRDSDARFRNIVNQATTGVVQTDPAGQMTLVNQRWCDMLGYSEAELLQKTIHGVTHPESLAATRAAVRHLEAGGAGLVLEKRYLRKDGSAVWASSSINAVRGREGDYQGLVAVVLDITERKRSEARLEEQVRIDAFTTEISRHLTAQHELVDTLRHCTDTMVAHLDAAFARIWLLDDAHDVLELRASSGLYTHLDGAHARVPVGRFKVGLIASERKPHLTNEVIGDPRVPGQAWAQREGLVAFAGYPLIIDDRVVGVMAMFARHALSEVTLQAMESVANQIAVGVERKRSERAVRESEQRFRSIVSIITDIPWTAGPDGRFISLQAAWGAYTGQTWEELRDFGWLNALHPDDRPIVQESWTRACESRTTYETDGRLWHAATEQYRHVVTRATPLFDDDTGSVREWVGSCVDVHERYEAEQVLRRHQEQLHVALEASQTGTFRWNPFTDEFIEVDDHFKRLWGFRPDQPVKVTADVVSRVHPDDAAALAQAIDRCRDGSDFDREFRVIHPDGTVHWLLDRAKAERDANGLFTNLIGACTEITRRKQAEEAIRESADRLRFMAESMPQKLFTATPAGDIDYLNQQWTEFTGLPFEQIKGWGWTQFIHPDDVEENVRRWKRAIDTGEDFQIEHRFRRYDGVYHWHLSRARAMRDMEGAIVMWTGSNTDIDDAKRVQSELKEANRLKDDFLATLSHELRTPLNAILGWSHMLHQGTLPPETQRRALEALNRNAKAQAQLVDDLLDVSRIMSGKLLIKTDVVDLAAVVTAAAETVRLSAIAKGIALRVSAEPERTILVNGDADRLQQVVWNLISNAIKFTTAGGEVVVGLRERDGMAEVWVKDSGQGITADFLPHVFERFRQADSTTTRGHGGLGLGLGIVRHLTEAHGGSVAAESGGEGQGATFAVRLPLRAEPAPSERDGRGAVQGTTPTAAVLSGTRALIVDDETDARELLRTVLEHRGAEVTTAGSAGEALHELQSGAFDVLLCDIGMPGQDGYSLIQAVRALPADRGGRIPAIAVTAYTSLRERQAATEAGFNWHVGKPVEPEQIVALVLSAVAPVSQDAGSRAPLPS